MTGMSALPAQSGRRWRPVQFADGSPEFVLGLVALIVYPITMAMLRTFVGPEGLDLTPLQDVLGDPAFGRAFLNTLIVIVVAGGCALAIGSFFAWFDERTDATWVPSRPLRHSSRC